MKLDITLKDAESIGAILKLVNNSRLLDDDGQPITGKISVTINSHLSVVLNLYNRILKAEKGGLSKAEMTDQEKPKRKRKKKEKKDTTPKVEENGNN